MTHYEARKPAPVFGRSYAFEFRGTPSLGDVARVLWAFLVPLFPEFNRPRSRPPHVAITRLARLQVRK